MSKALKTAGMVIAGVALVATGVGAAAGVGLLGASASALAAQAGAWAIAGVSLQTLTAVGTGLAFLGDATAKPLKVGGVAGTQVDFAADPNAPIPYAVGRTGTGGRIIYATTGEAKNRNILYNTVLSGGAPLNGVVSFKANDEGVEFGPLQQAITSSYANRMWQNRQVGAMPSPAFGPPNTLDPAVLGEWTTAHKLSGYMASWYVLGYDQKTYANGVPKAVWTIEGACVYDPRLDSTYAGGMGAHRINDPATWTWSENPWLHALAWSLGRYANGVRVLGIGARPALIDFSAAVEGANIADANGWKVGGVVYSNDSKWDVLKAMCQAGGGRPVQLGASITFLVNTPRVALATLTPDDIVGGYSVQAAQSVRGRPNQIIPKYRSEAHNWEMVAAGPVKVAAYVAADRNRLRSREVDYPLVQDAKQVAQLAAYDLVNAREFGPVTVPCKPAWMGYKRGDCINVAVPDLAMNGQKALILARIIDPMTGAVSLTLQSETDAKHDFALGRTASPPPIPGLTGVDPLPQAPANGSWAAIGTVLTAADGSQMPAIVVTGSVDDPNASHLIVEYRKVGDEVWSGAEYPASTHRVEITGLISQASYQVRVRYRSVRNLEDVEVYLDLGTVTVGRLIASSTLNIGEFTAAQIKAYTELTTLADGNARDALLRVATAMAASAKLYNDLLKDLTPASGRPVGATIDDQVRIVETQGETIIEHHTEMVAGLAGNAAAIQIEALTRAAADSALSVYQIDLAALVAANYATVTSQLSTLTTNQSATANSLLLLTASFNSNVTTVSNQLTALSNENYSQGISISSLTSTSNGLVSSVSIMSTTLSALNGQVGSAFGIRLVAGNVTTGIRGINNGVEAGWLFDVNYFGISTGGFGSAVYPFFVSGSTVYMTNVVISGSLLVLGSVDFAQLASRAATSTTRSNASWTVGGGSSQTVLSHYVYLAKAGTVDSDASISQHFPSGDRNWEFQLWIDGEMQDRCYGANGFDKVALMGSKDCSAGYKLVEVYWSAQATVNIDYRILKSMGSW